MRRLAVGMVLALSALSWADVVPLDVGNCAEKPPGTACTTEAGGAGTCQSATCSRNDYSQGVPPKQVEVACLKCLPPPAPPAPAPAPVAPVKPKGSCAAAPGLALAGAAVLLAAWTRRRRR